MEGGGDGNQAEQWQRHRRRRIGEFHASLCSWDRPPRQIRLTACSDFIRIVTVNVAHACKFTSKPRGGMGSSAGQRHTSHGPD